LICASSVASVGATCDTDSLVTTGTVDACADTGKPHVRQLIEANAARPTVRILMRRFKQCAPMTSEGYHA
jgi:hypothetical protein